MVRINFVDKIEPFPEMRSTSVGVPMIRVIAYWGPYLDSLIYGNYRHESIAEIRREHRIRPWL